jgi:VWFA-related protein
VKQAVAALLLALVALPSPAQTPAPAGEVIDVQITNLDVVVTDAKGKRIAELTKGDFQVFENGKPQEISNLSEIGRTGTSTAETIQPAPRRVLLIVDNGTIALSARRKVFDATRGALERLILNASDRVAIATISRSVTERLGWTSDRAAVMRALAEVEQDAILPNADLLAFERSLDSIIDEANAASASMDTGAAPEGGTGGVPPPPGEIGGGRGGGKSGGGSRRNRPPVQFGMLVSYARNYAASATNETRQTLSALNAALSAFAAVPGGRKIVILVGGGLPINAADAAFQKIETLREQFERDGNPGMVGARNASTLTQISGYDVGREVDALGTAAKLKGIAFYAVNPEFGDRLGSNARASAPADSIAEFAVMRGMLDGYQRLATMTGGAAMIGRPAESAVTEIVNDLDSYYSLGYRASGPLDPKTEIVVKVRKGLTARTTLASGAISRDWEVADQVLANHLLEPVNPMSISVVLDPAVVEGDRKMIPMKIMIPVNSLKLVEDQGEYTASFAVFVSLGDSGGSGSDPSRQEQSFHWPENVVAQVKEKTIGFVVNLEVSAGRDRVSVGVLDRYSGTAGFTRVMLN